MRTRFAAMEPAKAGGCVLAAVIAFALGGCVTRLCLARKTNDHYEEGK